MSAIQLLNDLIDTLCHSKSSLHRMECVHLEKQSVNGDDSLSADLSSEQSKEISHNSPPASLTPPKQQSIPSDLSRMTPFESAMYQQSHPPATFTEWQKSQLAKVNEYLVWYSQDNERRRKKRIAQTGSISHY
eukprot:159619_1